MLFKEILVHLEGNLINSVCAKLAHLNSRNGKIIEPSLKHMILCGGHQGQLK